MKPSRIKKMIGLFGLIVLILTMTEMEKMSIFTYKNVVRYERTEGVFQNPLMGFAIDADQVEEAENHALVYVDVTFRELEPEEGTFDFEAIEKNNHLKHWKDSGKHVVFRFISDYPGSEEHLDIPDWLYEKTDGDGAFYNNSYGMGYAPNYNNPIFIEHHAKAIEALGKHFGQDHFFGFVQLGSLGHWGEWHSYFETGVDKIPDEETREQYILPYLEAFPNAKIMMRQPFEAADIHGFGIYNDMTGHVEETIDWLDTIQNGGQYDQTSEEGGLISMENAWKTVPIGGEFTSSIPMHEMIVQNIDQTLKFLKASHTTYLGPRVPNKYDDTSDLFQEGTKKVLEAIGYRIGIKEMEMDISRFSDKIKIKLLWENTGLAPMYWDWLAYLYLENSSGELIDKIMIDIKLSKLLPGIVKKTKNEIHLEYPSEEDYSLYIGIEDPERNEPAVYFAMDTERKGTLSLLHVFTED